MTLMQAQRAADYAFANGDTEGYQQALTQIATIRAASKARGLVEQYRRKFGSGIPRHSTEC